MLTRVRRAWRRNFLPIVNAPGNGFSKRVLSFGEGLGLIGPRGEAFWQIAERNNDFARAIYLKMCGIYERHGTPLMFFVALLQIAPAEAQLTNHGRQKAGRYFLAAVFYNGLARAVIQRDVTAFTSLGINANRDVAFSAYLMYPVDELSARHVSFLLFHFLVSRPVNHRAFGRIVNMSGQALPQVVDGARVFGPHVDRKAAAGAIGTVGAAAVQGEAVVQAQRAARH